MSDCLVHFNQNHSPKNGQFTFGDGDGDGIINDHLNQMRTKRMERKDTRWAKRNYGKIYKKAYKPIRKEMDKYVKSELNPKYRFQLRSGKISKSYMNEYNKKLASLMNEQVDELPTSPSGRVIKFVAKRGDIGVHMALADADYDMSRFRNGIYDSGRVAYRKNVVNKLEI